MLVTTVVTLATVTLAEERPETMSDRDRHRGGGHPPTPATPPCVRVRTRRFGLVTLASIDQRWKSERCEVSIGKAPQRGLWPGPDTRGQIRCQPCCRPVAGEPPVQAKPLGDGVVFSIAAT